MSAETAAELAEDFAAYARADWLATLAGRCLHWADLTRLTTVQIEGIRRDWLCPGPLRLACGRTASLVMIPGLGARLAAPRCAGCCRATGLPYGTGSPKNDDACRRLLGARVSSRPG